MKTNDTPRALADARGRQPRPLVGIGCVASLAELGSTAGQDGLLHDLQRYLHILGLQKRGDTANELGDLIFCKFSALVVGT